jgi:hypothetical protein
MTFYKQIGYSSKFMTEPNTIFDVNETGIFINLPKQVQSKGSTWVAAQ